MNEIALSNVTETRDIRPTKALAFSSLQSLLINLIGKCHSANEA